MFDYAKARYDKYGIFHAGVHALASGLIVSFFTRFGPWGFLALLCGPTIEFIQSKTDPAYDLHDGIYDAAEWLVGGLIAGAIFYLTRGL